MGPRSGDGALVGREPELEMIRSFLARTADDGQALLLSGEAGVGKTALLNVAVQGASWLGMRVVRAAGVEFEADIGFAGLNQILLPLRAEFDLLDPGHKEALDVALGLYDGPSVNRLLVSNAVLELLGRASTARRLLIIVDDLQWLDQPSAAVLGFVIRRMPGRRLAVLAARRAGAGQLNEHLAIPELEVEALTEESAALLVSTHFPDLDTRIRGRLLAEAQGNPLALLELPAAFNGTQLPALAGLPSVLPLSRRLLSLFASQISDLPDQTRELLLLAVLDGLGDLRTLLGSLNASGSTGTLAALAPAERSGLVQVTSDTHRVVFRHPLIRSAVVELSTSEERRQAHQVLAEAWRHMPERRAWHLAQATLGPDEDVALLLEQSARRILRRGDAVGAVTALTRAADLSPMPRQRGHRLAEAAYIGADVTGQLHDAARLLDEARRIEPEIARSWQAAVTTAHILFYRDGDVDTAHRLLVQAIADRTGVLAADDDLVLGALHTLLMVCWSGGRPELWPPFHAALARLSPEPPAILTVCAHSVSDPARTPPHVVGELDALIRALPHEQESTRIIRVGLAAVNLHRTSDCREAYDRVERDGREGGAITSAIKAMAIMSTEDVWTGRWQEAGQKADETLEYCDAHGYRFLACTAQYTLALLAALDGDQARASSLADELSRWAGPRNNVALGRHATHVRLLTALSRGDAEEAFGHAAAISPPGTLPSHVPHAVLVGLDLVESAMRTDRRAEAVAHVAAMRQAGIADLSPRPALFVATSAALTAPEDRAEDLFQQALSIPGIARWPFDLARTHLLYGEWLRRTRATTQARGQLTTALDIFERLGAQPWAVRAGNELRAAGQPSARTAAAGSARLTSRENEIALLAAAGLSNKQIGERLFLSPRTVGYHLHQIFPKLGVTSRAALRDALSSTAQPPDNIAGR